MPEKDMKKQGQPKNMVPENYDAPENGELQPRLDEIDLLNEQISEAKEENGHVWIAALQKLKVRWTTDSNAIEGSSLSYGDTLFFLQEGLTVKGKPFKDYLDARNHADAIDILFDFVADRRPISTSLIKEINALLLLGVKETPAMDAQGRQVMKPAKPGEFKTGPNHVLLPGGGMHFYVEPLQVPGQMERLVEWIAKQESRLHPAVTAAIAHYNMVHIHPFDDGNGRGARILMNLILMKAGLPPAVIENENREDYLKAIREADKGDLRPFIAFVLDAVSKTEQTLLDDLINQ